MINSLYNKIAKKFYGTGISKYKIIRESHNLLTKKIGVKQIEIFGFQMHLDKNDEGGYSLINPEKNNELNEIKKYINEGDIVVDIGANIGFFTLFFRSIVGKKGKVISFEPEIKNYEVLKKNVEINNLENVKCYRYAIGSEKKELRLNVSEFTGQHNIDDSGEIKVECFPLDDVVKNVNFIKIDTEGYEVQVLNGMKQLLKNKPIIVLEFYYKLLKKYNEPREIFTILSKYNYEFFDLRNNMKINSIDEFLSKYNFKSPATDILCK